MSLHIDLVGLVVDDPVRARDFYVDTLGFRLETDEPMGEHRLIVLTAPGSPDVRLMLEPAAFPPAARYQRELAEAGIPATSFGVDDLDATYARLVDAGVRFTMPPTTAGTFRIAVLDDTCGNRIQLHQR